MSALGDIASALGPAAQGIGQGLLGGAERQNALQQQAFAQGQARTKMDLDKQELQLRQKALDSQETQQARGILGNMLTEVQQHRNNPALQSYWQGAGKDMAAQMDDWLSRGYHALASNKASDLFSLMQEHPEAAMHHATAAGVPLPPGAQAQPATPASGGNGTPTGGSAPPVTAPPAAGPAGGAAPPVSPEVKALVASLFGLPQSADLPPGVAGPQPPPGAFRDATGTVMPPAASTPAPTVGASAPAAGAAPVAPAGSPATAGQQFATYSDIANAAGVPNAAAPTLPAALQAVAGLFVPKPGETPDQELTRITTGVKSLSELNTNDQARVQAWLGYHKDVMDRASTEAIAKSNNDAAMARTQAEQGGQMARTTAEIGSREKVAAGEQATQLVGHALTYQAAAATLGQRRDQDAVTDAQRAITTLIQDNRAKATALRGQLTALVREDIASQAKVTNGIYHSTTGSGGVNVGLAGMGGINAALAETGGDRSSVTQTQFYNTPEHQQMLSVLNSLHNLVNSTPPFVPGNARETRLVGGDPINDQDRAWMRNLVGADGSNALAFNKKFGPAKSGDPAFAIRMIHAYQDLFPNKPLPKGVSLGAISNPAGLAAKATAPTPAAPTAATTPEPFDNRNPVGSLLNAIGRRPNSGSQPGEPLGGFGGGGLSQ